MLHGLETPLCTKLEIHHAVLKPECHGISAKLHLDPLHFLPVSVCF